MAPQFEQAVRESVWQLRNSSGSNYHIQSGKLMFEIKQRGFSKATAIQAFMKEFAVQRPAAGVRGDDRTYQDGFGMVAAHGGISIGVGDRVQGQYTCRTWRRCAPGLQRIAALHDSHRA